MDKEFENNNETNKENEVIQDVSQLDIESILDNGVSDELVSGSTEEEKKANRKKLKEQILVSANLGKNVIIAGLLYPLEETPTEPNIPPYLFGLENKEVKFIISGIVLPKTEDSNKSEKRKNIQEEFNKNKSSFIESLKQYLS